MYNNFSDIKKYRNSITQKDNTMKNIITNNNFKKISLNNKVVQKSHHFYNNRLNKDELGVSDQHNSGRCWIFAFTNMIQRHMLKKYKIKEFNISHTYLSFWDKFEKCHTYLKRIEETKKLDINDRIMFNLLKQPIDDGGQWSMIVNIVNKYGVIPKSSMKETYNSKNTEHLNYILNLKLRQYAHKLRSKPIKKKTIFYMMKNIYKILVYFLGHPPKKINWTFVLKDTNNPTKHNKFTKHNKPSKHNKLSKHNKTKKRQYVYDVTPLDFYKNYVQFDINNYVSLINAPSKVFYKKYQIKYNTNMYKEGVETEFINIPIDKIKDLVIQSLDKKEPVWFSCDFGQLNSEKHSLLYDNVFKYEDILDVKLFLDKKNALLYKQVEVNHAMLMVGYHKKKNKVTKWLVENSHGKLGSNNKGEYYMNDKWFDSYLFEIVVSKDYLDKKIKHIITQKPVMLPMWDPFGDVS